MQKGMSQEDVARNLGVTRSTVCRLEKGKGGPTVHTAHAISVLTEQSVPVMAWFKGVKS